MRDEAWAYPRPHPSDRSLRVLVVTAALEGALARQILHLVRALDATECRVDVLPCQFDAPPDADLWRALEAAGAVVDGTVQELGPAETVAHVTHRLNGCELVLACGSFDWLSMALGRRHHSPPVVLLNEAQIEVPPALLPHLSLQLDRTTLERADPGLWNSIVHTTAKRITTPEPRLFQSFVQGGFECSTHRLRSGRRLDVIAATGHDRHCAQDYGQLSDMGLATLRDGARWHLIETRPGHYDFGSFRPMVQAARDIGVQVIWDLMHYGWPDDLDIWGPDFVDRFAAFAKATARSFREETDAVPFWCPVNEISFLAWGGGDMGYLNPFGEGRGLELKVQLVRASLAAMRALREIDPRARFVQCEPLIAIHHNPTLGLPRTVADRLHEAQYEVADMLAGKLWPQLGGAAGLLDIVGINYYHRNQWQHLSDPMDVDDQLYRPLSDLLVESHARHGRPMVISETGIEDGRRASWFRYVAAEVARARQRGVPVEGICLYPILNHPGWDDDRDCQNGLLTMSRIGDRRGTDPGLEAAVRDVVAGMSRG